MVSRSSIRYLSCTWDSSKRRTGSKHNATKPISRVTWSPGRMHLFAHLKPGFTFTRASPVGAEKSINLGKRSMDMESGERRLKRFWKCLDAGETSYLRQLLRQLIACSARGSIPRSLELTICTSIVSLRNGTIGKSIESRSRHLRRKWMDERRWIPLTNPRFSSRLLSR